MSTGKKGKLPAAAPSAAPPAKHQQGPHKTLDLVSSSDGEWVTDDEGEGAKPAGSGAKDSSSWSVDRSMLLLSGAVLTACAGGCVYYSYKTRSSSWLPPATSFSELAKSGYLFSLSMVRPSVDCLRHMYDTVKVKAT